MVAEFRKSQRPRLYWLISVISRTDNRRYCSIVLQLWNERIFYFKQWVTRQYVWKRQFV